MREALELWYILTPLLTFLKRVKEVVDLLKYEKREEQLNIDENTKAMNTLFILSFRT